MRRSSLHRLCGPLGFAVLLAPAACAQQPAATNAPPPPAPAILLPMGRTAYFVGENVPLVAAGFPAGAKARVEAVNADGRVLLFEGAAGPWLLDTAGLAPGDYRLDLNGTGVVERFTLTSPLSRSAASLQDECTPREPQFEREKKYTEAERRDLVRGHWDDIVRTMKESGLSACLALAASDMGRAGYLDAMARAGALLLVNPDTRPTSFIPGTLEPTELDSMSQRMILTAQANGRHPNFGGFCFGWDTTGYAIGNRRMLLIYWGWGDQTDALRRYIERIDRFKEEEFIRRTGIEPVSEKDYIAYLLAAGQGDLVPRVDLPVNVWVREMARQAKPMPEPERAAFERRSDAWSAYIMDMYRDVYGGYVRNLASVSPTLQHTSSVQIDHAATRQGQCFPSAYAPLSLRYQSTWNDQVGGPDYLFQWLITQGLLDMERGDTPTWISSAIATAHDRAPYPGKFTRVAAHGLAYGASGIGFACEGFSNLLGGMNRGSNWDAIRGRSGGEDVLAGRDFLDRFAALALAGRARNGAGILFSRTQYARQNVVPAFGSAPFQAFVSLARLGYTPCFLTEDDVVAGRLRGVKAVLVLGQTVPLPPPVQTALERFAADGGRLLTDGNTRVTLAGTTPLDHTFDLSPPGRPHNWGVPNMPAGENDVTLIAAWHRSLAPVLRAALGDAGLALFAPEKGAETDVSVFGLHGGPDASYVVAVNDASIQTPADWYQVRETLVPATGATGFLYDATSEALVGPVGPLPCDLTSTTARVLAVLPRPLQKIELTARQTVGAGSEVPVSVAFADPAGSRLVAVLPFHLSLIRPDGAVHQEFYRATDTNGTFRMTIPVPANAPPGNWELAVRSQLSGALATLPVKIEAGSAPARCSRAIADPVIVRERAAIEAAFAKGASFVIPIFDSPQADALAAAADRVKASLARRGVSVEIRRSPETVTYTLGYELSAWKEAQNARADRGEVIGRIKRETINGNDWYSALSGWRFSRPVILLDLVAPPPPAEAKPSKDAQPVANPMAASLDRAGMLWPDVSPEFPGTGRAVVQLVHWAFAPRTPAIVIQAADAVGLLAGADALEKLPEDNLTPRIQAVRETLWRERHVGGVPLASVTEGRALTSGGLQTSSAPQPFVIRFPDAKPPTADQVAQPERKPRPAVAVPATFLPAQYTIFYRSGSNWVESATASMLVPDLRFSEAIQLVLDVPQPGKTRIVARGQFRYSDRQPCTQAQWEDYLALRRKLVPARRQPMAMDVIVNGKSLGKLTPSKTGDCKVMVRMSPLPHDYVQEEAVTELAGEVDLPAGRQEILLAKENVVDGKLEAVGVGMDPVVPEPPEAGAKK